MPKMCNKCYGFHQGEKCKKQPNMKQLADGAHKDLVKLLKFMNQAEREIKKSKLRFRVG